MLPRPKRFSPLRVRSGLYIERPPAHVWRLFDPHRFPEWSPLCRDCRIEGGSELAPGADLLMRLDFRLFELDVRARVTRLFPFRRIQWEAEYLGARFRHAYRLRPFGGGTFLSNRELIDGLGTTSRYLLRRFFRATNLSLASLQGIKRVAEATASPHDLSSP